jgi:hypothetical protein
VTGVQTCALPISTKLPHPGRFLALSTTFARRLKLGYTSFSFSQEY